MQDLSNESIVKEFAKISEISDANKKLTRLRDILAGPLKNNEKLKNNEVLKTRIEAIIARIQISLDFISRFNALPAGYDEKSYNELVRLVDKVLLSIPEE